MFIVTADVRHLAVWVRPEETTADARRRWWPELPFRQRRALCGSPMPRSAWGQSDWSHLDDLQLAVVLGEKEQSKWRRAIARPVCTRCLRTIDGLVAATAIGVQR